MTEKRNWNQVLRQAFLAGIVAGVILELYLILTAVLPAHGSVVQTWQWIASAAIGDVAFSSPSYAILGLLIHFVISIAWAGGFAYLAQQQPFVKDRWIVSGLVYGVIVYFFMDLLLLGARKLVFPAPAIVLLNTVFAHAVFFGLPIAYVVNRTSSPSAR